jgi:hypothetical protein
MGDLPEFRVYISSTIEDLAKEREAAIDIIRRHALYDNSLAGYEKPFVRYRSPTEGGNSGSPVFNRQLKSFAIHHRALEDMRLNEGILLNEIKAALAQKHPEH